MARKLHAIGNAHIDPVWLWSWQEGLQEVKATFRSALDRMNESGAFTFSASSAAFYAWVAESDPAMFEEIRARVIEGRWEVVGGTWIEPDCNIPSGESFVRQALVGQRWLHRHLGVIADVAWAPDAFGHHAMLPQLCVKSRLRRYVFLRPQAHEKTLPARLFSWESADGSRVLAFRIPNEYCTPPEDIEAHVRKCSAELGEPVDELMCFYGVGNHGGGPTRANLASLARLDGHDGLPAIELSTAARYFDAVEGRALSLPIVHGELQHHARGCYSAHAGVKRWNRRAEHALLAAERLAVVARGTCGHRSEDLERAWRGVLFNQFHDILAGTSIPSAYEDARDLYGEATATASRVENAALQAISWRIGIACAPGDMPLIVFNPHPWVVRAPVEVEVGGLQEDHVLVDDEGRPASMQPVRSQAIVQGWRRRVAFVAELPPLGWRVYRLVKRAGGAAASPPEPHDLVAEGRRFRVTVDRGRGCIAGVFDKQRGIEVFAGPAARGVVLDDPSDTWAHGIARFDRVVGELAGTTAAVVERGPVMTVLRVEGAFGASTVVLEIVVYREIDRIDLRIVADWREKRRVLKLRFPVAVDAPEATFEVPFGHAVRQGGDEEPAQSFVDVSGTAAGTRYGVALVNTGKHAFDVDGADIGMTVARSAIFAHHDPFVPRDDGTYAYLDQGMQELTCSLVVHDGDWRDGDVPRIAWEVNQPARALFESAHAGPLPLSASFLSVEPAGIVVSAVKPAEDAPGEAFIVRAYEAQGRAARARFVLGRAGRTFESDFGPCEIKTYRVPFDPAAPVVEVDLLEWPPGAPP